MGKVSGGGTGYGRGEQAPSGGEPSPPLMTASEEEERESRLLMGAQFENDGKHSLLQFALKYFRQKDKFQHVGVSIYIVVQRLKCPTF